MGHCKYCDKNLHARNAQYCDNQCQANYAYKQYIEQWKGKLVSGNRGKQSLNISGHVIRYIKSKYNNSCAQCGWAQINQFSLTSPLEINHIDGNAHNTTEANLILLCPNCHSLTNTHKNLNKGYGRLSRTKKYGIMED